jgi:hypothetical protein
MQLERRASGAGFFVMNPSKDYRKFAQECDRLARDAKTEQHRQILQEMAEAWEELAEACDRNRSP